MIHFAGEVITLDRSISGFDFEDGLAGVALVKGAFGAHRGSSEGDGVGGEEARGRDEEGKHGEENNGFKWIWIHEGKLRQLLSVASYLSSENGPCAEKGGSANSGGLSKPWLRCVLVWGEGDNEAAMVGAEIRYCDCGERDGSLYGERGVGPADRVADSAVAGIRCGHRVDGDPDT